MSENIAPAPQFPEVTPTLYERRLSPAVPGQAGPLRFQEGVGTDTDIPNNFAIGVSQGYAPAPGRPNRNAPVWIKPPQETMSERAHVGSAAWVEAPEFLGEFAHGAFTGDAEVKFEEVIRNGAHQFRPNPVTVTD
jgi:hypothetical protein